MSVFTLADPFRVLLHGACTERNVHAAYLDEAGVPRHRCPCAGDGRLGQQGVCTIDMRPVHGLHSCTPPPPAPWYPPP